MDVLTIGESMVLLTPNHAHSLEQATTFTKHMAGAESNVAIALARLGHSVSWVSRVGKDGFGQYILKTLRGEGVDITGVTIDDSKPTGIFFKERSLLDGTSVQYYRKFSAASALSMEDIKPNRFQHVRMFHVTGITPALSSTNRATMFALLEEARRMGVQISFDPNIRLKLWSVDEAVSTLREMVRYADIALPGMEEGSLLTGNDTPEGIANWFIAQGCKLVVIKLGPAGAYYQNATTSGFVDGFKVPLVDEVGAGDAFAAGLLSGLLDDLAISEAVKRACALGAMAVCGEGDYETLPNREALFAFMEGRSTIVKR